MRNIKVGQCNEAVIRINLQYEGKEKCDRSFPPVVRNVNIENITCQKSKFGVLINGLNEDENIYNIHVKDCTFNNVASKGNMITGKTKNIQFDNLTINGKKVKEAKSNAVGNFEQF